MDIFTCIYCLEKKPSDKFNREHVIPEAFGIFGKNLVLYENQVCGTCNDHFGATIEAALAYASPPGIRRYLTGHKDLVELPKAVRHKSARGKVKVHIDSEDPLEADDVEFVSTKDGKGLTRTLGVKYRSKKSNKWRFASLRQIEHGEETLTDIGNPLVIVTSSESQSLSNLEAALRQFHPKVKLDLIQTYDTLQSGEKVRVAFDTLIEDDLVQRAIAKIAFNYLTYVYGVHIALNRGFNHVREYIRYGKHSNKKFVRRISSLPIKSGAKEARERGGHVLLIDWAPRVPGVIANLALFCMIPYEINFGVYQGIYPAKVASIHYFDFRTKTVTEQRAIPQYTGLSLPALTMGF